MEENNNKTLEVFTKALSAAIEVIMKQQYGLQVAAEPHMTLKTNGERQALSIRFEKSAVSPTIYTEDLFRQYQSGTDIDDIAKKVSLVVHQAHIAGPQMPEFSIEEARKHIRLAVVNTERNAQLLKTTSHFEIGDISAIPRWYIDDEASFIVSSSLAAQMGMTSDEILQLARENTLAQEYSVMKMSDMIKEIMINDGMDPDLAEMLMPEETLPLYVITGKNQRLDGASCILNDAVLEDARQQLDTDSMIVLPSSRHEVIVLAESEDTDPISLGSMVREINGSTVSQEDFLSDNIMKWDGRKLKMVFPEPAMEAPTMEAPRMTMRMGMGGF